MPDASWQVRAAVADDEAWLAPIFAEARHILGFAVRQQLFAYTRGGAPRSYWLVVAPLGFVAGTKRRDGVTSVYSIAVARAGRRQRVGQALLDALPRPILAKT